MPTKSPYRIEIFLEGGGTMTVPCPTIEDATRIMDRLATHMFTRVHDVVRIKYEGRPLCAFMTERVIGCALNADIAEGAAGEEVEAAYAAAFKGARPKEPAA